MRYIKYMIDIRDMLQKNFLFYFIHIFSLLSLSLSIYIYIYKVIFSGNKVTILLICVFVFLNPLYFSTLNHFHFLCEPMEVGRILINSRRYLKQKTMGERTNNSESNKTHG